MKELLKSVHICLSYAKYKTSSFYGPRCSSWLLASTKSMVMMPWLLQLISCCGSVVIAVDAILLSATVLIAILSGSVIIALSIVCVWASTSDVTIDDNCSDNQSYNAEDGSRDWHSNWCATEFSRTCRVWHRVATCRHCTVHTRISSHPIHDDAMYNDPLFYLRQGGFSFALDRLFIFVNWLNRINQHKAVL